MKTDSLTPQTLGIYSEASSRYWHDQDHVPLDSDGGEVIPKAHFRASMLGKCMVAQLTWRAGIPSRTTIDAASRARMDAGNTYEDGVRIRLDRMGLLLGSQIRLTDADLDVTGTVDLMWGGKVQSEPWWWAQYKDPLWLDWLRFLRGQVRTDEPYPVTIDEVKTVGNYGFTNAKQGRSDHHLQLGCYRLLIERHLEDLPGPEPDRYEILLINRDSGFHRPIPLSDDRTREAEDRLGTLKEAWETGNWPECTCGQTPDLPWEPKYCAYPNEDGDGCCGSSLLERLTKSVEATR